MRVCRCKGETHQPGYFFFGKIVLRPGQPDPIATARAEGYAVGVEKAEAATRAVFGRWARPEYGLLLSDVRDAIRALAPKSQEPRP